MKKFLPLIVLILVSCATPNMALYDYHPPEGWVMADAYSPEEINLASKHEQEILFKKDDRYLILKRLVSQRMWFNDLNRKSIIDIAAKYGESTVENSLFCSKFNTEESFAVETIYKFPYESSDATRRSLYIVNKADNGKAEITRLSFLFTGEEPINEFASAVSHLQ